VCKSIPKRKLLCRKIQIMHHLSEHPNVIPV
jgi:hypothetical protein